MPKAVPPFVVRPHDPAQQRRVWGLLAVAWIASSLIVAALASGVAAYVPKSDVGARLAAAEAENESLKVRVAMLDRAAQVAKAALADVQQTLRERDEEIAGLRADLAFYGRLVGGGRREGLAVHALQLAPVRDSQAWNFTVTLTQNYRRGQDTKGRVSLGVEGVQDGKLTTLDWSALNQGQNSAGIEYGFKYFQQVGGTIMLPRGFTANRVTVRADGDGGRVEQEFSWADAAKGEEGDDVRQ
ncbi:MAG TPA: DUF6776 family protein [Dokdonella sp.]